MRRLSLVCCVVLFFTSALAAQETGEAFFEARVRPVLVKQCYSCHSHQAKRARGGLMLDSRAALLRGGDSGAVVVPGKPNDSLLIKGIRHTDSDFQMPPKGKLPEADIAALTKWVELGAPWPEGKKDDTRAAGHFSDEDRKWWAIQPLRKIEPPKVDAAAWSANPIDRFIHARLRAEGLQPSPAADRRTLLRRVKFDLTGLPPTPEELEAFVKDDRPDAVERLVDRLLDSPQFGEHWARHWLDLVRYAESDGFRQDAYRPDSWRYRDYVIDAFNRDKPFDRFVREQLAGDEIAPHDPKVLVATAYLRHGIYEFNQRDVRTQWQDILDDITSVTGEVFLGLGMGCARCHDHKYDPILRKDYYRLQAFFAPILPRNDVPLATPQQLAEFRTRITAWDEKTAALRKQIDDLAAPARKRAEAEMVAKFPRDIQEILRKPVAERTPLEIQLGALAYRQVLDEGGAIEKYMAAPVKKKYEELNAALTKSHADKPSLPGGLTAMDVGPVAPAVHIPGKVPGPAIEPGFLSILDEAPAVITGASKTSTGRRLALAQWLTRPDHPLTARVLVNRLWQQLFGVGIVGTANDFGRVADQPTHPELLDWLALHFVQEGWSMKKMIRLMVTTQAYRQASVSGNAEALAKDPENTLLWRGRARRLSAEQIRDAILSATGQMDLKVAGPSVEAKEPRRTIYLKMRRNTREPLLDVFDLADGFASTARRNVTTTPVQALLMVNSPFMAEQAKAFAERLVKAHPKSDEAQVTTAFRLAFGREASRDELDGSLDFLAKQALRVGGDASAARRVALIDFCQVLLNANEFVYLD